MTVWAAKQLQLDGLHQIAMQQAAGLQADWGLMTELRAQSDDFAGLLKLAESQQVIMRNHSHMYR